MTSDRACSVVIRSLLAIGSVLTATLTACVAVAPEDPQVAENVQITVMTRNLYVGTGMGDVFRASSWSELVAAGSQAWATLLASDFPTRAGALADEITQAGPDVVGLQEVTLWRDQSPGDVLTQPIPNATDVALDFLELLQGELTARGVPYISVATSTGVDVEFPRQGPGGGLVDLRLTDRDVLMVRADLADSFTNPRHGHYTAQFSEPFLIGPGTSTRGWVSIDYRPDPATTPVRIFATHLEVADPVTGGAQERQADEFLAMIAESPYPVIALGDFNAPADGALSPTYQNLTAVLDDAWTSARKTDRGSTCCQAPSLADAVGRDNMRIDLVLTSEDLPVTGVARTGDEPFRSTPPPLWASDHFGVTARIELPAV
ncbi:endonuclease/exonuclease/phosphatase family protein [Geodermatophilus sp. URMC 64]